jgi:hypothetical protein
MRHEEAGLDLIVKGLKFRWQLGLLRRGESRENGRGGDFDLLIGATLRRDKEAVE